MSATTTDAHRVAEPDHAYGGQSGVTTVWRTASKPSQGKTGTEIARHHPQNPGRVNRASDMREGSVKGSPRPRCSSHTSNTLGNSMHLGPFPGSN